MGWGLCNSNKIYIWQYIQALSLFFCIIHQVSVCWERIREYTFKMYTMNANPKQSCKKRNKQQTPCWQLQPGFNNHGFNKCDEECVTVTNIHKNIHWFVFLHYPSDKWPPNLVGPVSRRVSDERSHGMYNLKYCHKQKMCSSSQNINNARMIGWTLCVQVLAALSTSKFLKVRAFAKFVRRAMG